MSDIRITGDGSHTLFDALTGEHYHSSFGALTESTHIFIENGISRVEKQSIAVFEAGFGTGLNALLTLLWARENNKHVRYTAIELFPVHPEDIRKLNYPDLMEGSREHFHAIHQTEWGCEKVINEKFIINRIKGDIRNIPPLPMQDIVYYDAFSPSVQPELWTEEILANLFSLLNTGGILVSYCVRGTVKQALRDAGFRVKVLPGPPGKRHMLLAVKPER
jgi:tRNA U34 5-methylaminomethyl-2-thiouridine-forming methyltransferase MnmC